MKTPPYQTHFLLAVLALGGLLGFVAPVWGLLLVLSACMSFGIYRLNKKPLSVFEQCKTSQNDKLIFLAFAWPHERLANTFKQNDDD